METWKETSRRSNCLMTKVQRLWLLNEETQQITHLVEVDSAEPEGRQYKYPIRNLYTLKKPMQMDNPSLLREWPGGPVFMKAPPITPVIKLWSIKVDEPIQMNNREAAPIETWGLPSRPSSPSPPSPPPKQKTDEQKHAGMHWSVCRNPDCEYHCGHQSYYI
jgi:hypothetical protein